MYCSESELLERGIRGVSELLERGIRGVSEEEGYLSMSVSQIVLQRIKLTIYITM